MYKLPEGYSGKQIYFFDCTKDYDSDTFFKNDTVNVVTTELGTYLEGNGTPWERFGYRFKIENIDKPHMLIVRYPEDKRRHMMINDGFSYDLSTGVCTGAEYPVSGEIKEIHYIFWTRTHDLSLIFTTWGKGEPAAAFGFAIYELDELSKNECVQGGRQIGITYEDPCGSLSELGETTIEGWADKIVTYASHAGMNRFVYPINWYNGPIFDSECQPSQHHYWLSTENREQYSISSTQAIDWVSGVIDKCAEAGIEFIGSMTLLRLGNLLKNMNIDLLSIQNGADTYNNMRMDNTVTLSTSDWTINFDPRNLFDMLSRGIDTFDGSKYVDIYGEVEENQPGSPIFNPLHPVVQETVIEYISEIERRFGNKKGFGGISINIWHSTFLWFSSLKVGYDDYSVGLFEKEHNIDMGIAKNDPERFNKRYEYLMQNYKELWIDFRCRKIYEFIEKIYAAMKKENKNLKLYLVMWNEMVKLKVFRRFDQNVQYPEAINEYDFLREGGFDMHMYENHPGISVSVEQNQHRDRGWGTLGVDLPIEEQRFFHDISYLDTSWTDSQKNSINPSAFVFDSWMEIWGECVYYKFNEHNPDIDEALEKMGFNDIGRENVIFYKNTFNSKIDGYWFDSQRQITSCYPADINYFEPLIHAIAEFDAFYIVRGGLYLDKAHASGMKKLVKEFVALPDKKFITVGETDPVTVRMLCENGKTYIYAVNREPYPISVKINLSKKVCVKTLSDGFEFCNDDVIDVVLSPFSLKSFVADEKIDVVSHKDIISDEEWEKLADAYHKICTEIDRVKQKNITVNGIENIQAQMKNAYDNKNMARLRHLLKGYCCEKIRTLK